jgi:hypothetical protein
VENNEQTRIEWKLYVASGRGEVEKRHSSDDWVVSKGIYFVWAAAFELFWKVVADFLFSKANIKTCLVELHLILDFMAENGSL